MIRNRPFSGAERKSSQTCLKTVFGLLTYLVILLLSRKLGDPRRLGIDGDRDLVLDLDLDE